nr:hypothetical protein CFP56_56635 [Quercus suber]
MGRLSHEKKIRPHSLSLVDQPTFESLSITPPLSSDLRLYTVQSAAAAFPTHLAIAVFYLHWESGQYNRSYPLPPTPTTSTTATTAITGLGRRSGSSVEGRRRWIECLGLGRTL